MQPVLELYLIIFFPLTEIISLSFRMVKEVFITPGLKLRDGEYHEKSKN
jgi:hypothetical protein